MRMRMKAMSPEHSSTLIGLYPQLAFPNEEVWPQKKVIFGFGFLGCEGGARDPRKEVQMQPSTNDLGTQESDDAECHEWCCAQRGVCAMSHSK